MQAGLDAEHLGESSEKIAIALDPDNFRFDGFFRGYFLGHDRANAGTGFDNEIGLFKRPLADGEVAVLHDRVKHDIAHLELVTCFYASRHIAPKRRSQSHDHRFFRYDLVGARFAQALCPPAAQFHDGTFQIASVICQFVRNASGGAWLNPALHDAGVLQFFQPSRENITGNARKATLQFTKPLRGDEEIAHDEERPTFADKFQRSSEPAILTIDTACHAPTIPQKLLCCISLAFCKYG